MKTKTIVSLALFAIVFTAISFEVSSDIRADIADETVYAQIQIDNGSGTGWEAYGIRRSDGYKVIMSQVPKLKPPTIGGDFLVASEGSTYDVHICQPSTSMGADYELNFMNQSAGHHVTVMPNGCGR